MSVLRKSHSVLGFGGTALMLRSGVQASSDFGWIMYNLFNSKYSV